MSKIAFSRDAGATFGQPIQVDDGESVGRVDTLLLADGSALVCWLSGNVDGGAIKVRRVTRRRLSWTIGCDSPDGHFTFERLSANGPSGRRGSFRMDRIRQALAHSHRRGKRGKLQMNVEI